MEALNRLASLVPEGAKIGIDTSPFIYFIEGGSTVDAVAVALFEELLQTGRNPAVTSVVTLAEVLVQPNRLGRTDLVQTYSKFLTSGANLTLLELTRSIAERAARIRAEYGLRLPDAFQIATALESGASHFATNDAAFKRVEGCSVVVLSEASP